MKPHPKVLEMAMKYKRPVIEFGMRTDGRCEWFCEHGIGHTVDAPEEYKERNPNSWGIHGCDGCHSLLEETDGS